MSGPRVPRETRGTGVARRCSHCQTRTARAGQRTCAACHARLMKVYRARQKAAARALAWELRELRKAAS